MQESADLPGISRASLERFKAYFRTISNYDLESLLTGVIPANLLP
jgi:hypothetical protein